MQQPSGSQRWRCSLAEGEAALWERQLSCHQNFAWLWYIPTSIHASPPQNTKNTVYFASLVKNITFWVDEYGCSVRQKKIYWPASACGTHQPGVTRGKKRVCFFPQDLCVHLCLFPSSPVRHHQPPARIQAGRCVRGHSKGGFARLTPNTPACHRVGTYGKHRWQYQSWSINTFIVSVHAVCSLKCTDFARGVFYWWWDNPNQTHCWERGVCSHHSQRHFSPLEHLIFYTMERKC